MKSLHAWRHKPGMTLGAGADTTSQNAAARQGIKYHQKVYRQLEAKLTGGQLLVEPWFERLDDKVKRTMRQPDAIFLLPDLDTAVVIEVKWNWKSGRDQKLLDEYMPIVRSAFSIDFTYPLLITSCIRGYRHPPLLGLSDFDKCLDWQPGAPTPLMLLP